MASKCPNCGSSLGCGCQKRTLANGAQGCVNCAGQGKGNKAPVIAPKKKTNVITSQGKSPTPLQTWGKDRYNNYK